MNYYLPIGAPQNSKIKIPNDIVNDGDTHNVIKGFMPLDLSTGRKIRFSEIQYEGIGFTLIDLICQIKLDNMSLSMQLKNTSNGVR